MSTATTNKTNLKGGEFIIKESQWQDVYIPEQINEEQTAMREMTKDFIKKEIDAQLEKLEKDPMLSAGVIDKAGELGLLCIHIPEEYGGLGKDLTTHSFVTEVLGW